MRRPWLVALAGVLLGAAIVYVVLGGLVRSERAPQEAASAAGAEDGSEEEVRRIRASLFFVAEDGLRLVAVEREVPYGATPAEQARLILVEQLKPAPPPFAQALPPGTALQAVFLTDRGDAYVDLSEDTTRGHTGGSLDELFSVYAVVNAVTVNLPAVHRVQILIDGKEVDTMAGHIDLRRPLPKSLAWVQAPDAQSTSSSAVPTTGALP
jgi:hypothetical protein